MIPVVMMILAFIQRQMLDQRLSPHAFALHPRPSNGFMCFFAGGVHDIERHTCHIRNHDGPVRCFTFDLTRSGMRVRFRASVSFSHQLGLQFCNHITVLRMHHGNSA